MFKKNIALSVVATATIIFIGCGSSDSNSNVDLSSLPKVSNEAKTLAKSISTQGMFSSLIQSSKPNLDNRSRKSSRVITTDSCANGGTLTVDNGINPVDFQVPNFNFNDFNMTTSMEYDNCLIDGDITDGKIDTTVTFKGENDISFTMEYKTNMTVSTDEGEFKILKGSTIKEHNGFMTQTMNLTYADQTYKSEALKIFHGESNNGEYFTYPVSGKQTIGEEFYTVDSAYDASKTPMVIDNDGNTLKGGKYKYINSKEHKVTIEAIAKNKMQVSIDTDGDGKADQAEVVDI